MKSVISIAVLTMMLMLTATAQTAPGSAKDAAELTRLLQEFLAGATRNDAAVHDSFWADDVIYTASAGRRRDKADIMRDVRGAPAPKPGDASNVFTAEDVRIQQYGDTAIVAFRLVATVTKDARTEVTNYLNSGTLVKRNGKWQVVNWQSTRMPREQSAEKVQAAAETPSVDLPPELARVLRDYEAGWQKGDAVALANLFTEDGFVLPQGRTPVRGRAAIQKLYASSGAPLSLRALAYQTSGSVGYIIGGYSTERGKPDDGKFTLTLRKSEDGRWLIMSDMDNSNRGPQ
jgi:ketosteroid isomerase-like protein